MVSVTSEEQFYAVAQFAVPDSYVGDMYDSYGANTVIIVDVDRWHYVSFKWALELKEEYGFPISFEEFEMRYLETVPTDNVMTHKKEVKTMKNNNIIHANVGSETWNKYMEELNKEGDNINHPSHYKQFSREVIDTMQGVSTPEEFKGYLKLNAIKYLSRYQGKNGVEDLKKATWYISKLTEVVENEK